MTFEEDALKALQSARETYRITNEAWASKSGQIWFKSLNLGSACRLPGIENCLAKPTRAQLFALVRDHSVATSTLCAVILAWGGMRTNNGQKIFQALDNWRDEADKIRNGNASRLEAYNIFSKLRSKEYLPGMAPAYFTKLIFFLRGADVADTGYIMDQWAGCSVNILTGNPCAVLMNATYTWKVPKKGPKKLAADFQVSEHNTAEDYERFCRVVDEIAVITKLPPHDAELLLMSEGKGKGAWRKYVVDNRRLPATIPLFVKSESR